MDTSDADTDRLSLGAAPRSAVAPPGRSSPASAPAAAFSASLEHDPSAAASTRKSSRYSLVSSDRASSVMVSCEEEERREGAELIVDGLQPQRWCRHHGDRIAPRPQC